MLGTGLNLLPNPGWHVLGTSKYMRSGAVINDRKQRDPQSQKKGKRAKGKDTPINKIKAYLFLLRSPPIPAPSLELQNQKDESIQEV